MATSQTFDFFSRACQHIVIECSHHEVYAGRYCGANFDSLEEMVQGNKCQGCSCRKTMELVARPLKLHAVMFREVGATLELQKSQKKLTYLEN